MPFIMQCQNKKCRKQSLVLLDTINNKVYCGDCDEEINNITSFAKNQLKALGQIKKQESKKSHAILCSHCKKESTPVLENNNLLKCSLCHQEITHLTSIFKTMLIKKLKSTNEI